jgi:hypothetical protein
VRLLISRIFEEGARPPMGLSRKDPCEFMRTVS